MDRKRKRQKQNKNDSEGPSKQQLEIAKHIRFKTPSKGTQINKQDVTYFNGSKAIDTIMASKWCTGKGSTEVIFSSRNSAVDFMTYLLENQFFYRAMKNKPEKGKKKEIEDEKVTTLKQSSASEGSPKSLRQRKKKTENKEKQSETTNKEKGKVKKKYKLTVHEEQTFLDSNDIYIWVYSPIHPKNIFLGILLLCGVIGATLFPLWPPQVRTGVYYLSMGGAGCIGSIFVVALLRSILFAILWVCTMGNIRLWILPNILADVGFFDSFKPSYTYENQKEIKKQEKEKLSDNEDESSDKAGDNEDESSDKDAKNTEEENRDRNLENSAVESGDNTATS